MSSKHARNVVAGVAGLALLIAACGDDSVEGAVSDANEKVEEAAKDPSSENIAGAEHAVEEAEERINDRYQQIVSTFNANAVAIEAQAGDDYAKLNDRLAQLDGRVVAATGLAGAQRTDAWNDVNDEVEDISRTASDMEARLDGDAKDAVTTLISDLADLGRQIEAGLGLS